MHWSVLEFFEGTKILHPELFTGTRVLEVGSLDINGSVRPIFTDCEYVGLDLGPGPGVDVI